MVLKHVGRGYTSKSGCDILMKNHISSLCQYLYFILVELINYDPKIHEIHTYRCWCTKYALSRRPFLALIFSHFDYIRTTQTPSEYRAREFTHCAQSRTSSALLKNPLFIWGHPPSLSATDLFLDHVGFHLNLLSN